MIRTLSFFLNNNSSKKYFWKRFFDLNRIFNNKSEYVKKIKKYIHIIIIFNVESTSIILHANKKDPILYLHEYFSIFFSTFNLMDITIIFSQKINRKSFKIAKLCQKTCFYKKSAIHKTACLFYVPYEFNLFFTSNKV